MQTHFQKSYQKKGKEKVFTYLSPFEKQYEKLAKKQVWIHEIIVPEINLPVRSKYLIKLQIFPKSMILWGRDTNYSTQLLAFPKKSVKQQNYIFQYKNVSIKAGFTKMAK